MAPPFCEDIMEIIVEDFRGRLRNNQGEDITEEIAKDTGLDYDPNTGVALVESFTMEGSSPEDYMIVTLALQMIKEYLEDCGAVQADSMRHPIISDRNGKEIVC